MKRNILTFALISFMSIFISQAQLPDMKTSSFQFTFITPPLSNHGINSQEYINDLSVNLLIGNNGGVNGVEIGGLINIDKTYVKGTQLSGFMNIVHTEMNGVQIAGFGNHVSGKMEGVQISGFYNINSNTTNGTQFSGFMNIVEDSIDGFQLSGFANINNGFTTGFQAAGFTNINKEFNTGSHIAGFANIGDDGLVNTDIGGFMNIARDIKGIQIAGFMNIARNVKGIQLAGFMNICDSIHGIPISFINIPKKQLYTSFELNTSDVSNYSGEFKMGLRKWYNIYSFGKLKGDPNRWAFGFGFGNEQFLTKKLTLSIEAVCNQELWINEEDQNFLYIDRLFMLNQFKPTIGYYFNNSICVFAGPVFNMQIRNTSDNLVLNSEDLAPSWIITDITKKNNKRTNYKTWLGFTAGIRF
ncbi:hypothetical protein ACFLRZ_05405 [Bacteroidota bacterium]